MTGLLITNNDTTIILSAAEISGFQSSLCSFQFQNYSHISRHSFQHFLNCSTVEGGATSQGPASHDNFSCNSYRAVLSSQSQWHSSDYCHCAFVVMSLLPAVSAGILPSLTFYHMALLSATLRVNGLHLYLYIYLYSSLPTTQGAGSNHSLTHQCREQFGVQ